MFVLCHLELSRLCAFGTFSIKPKAGRCWKLSQFIADMLQKGSCSRADTATLGGKLGFPFSQLQGRVLRFADRPLIRRQYEHKKHNIPPLLESM